MKLDLIYEESQEEVRQCIRECEEKHPQQVAFSTFHDAITQVCYGCKTVRTNLKFTK